MHHRSGNADLYLRFKHVLVYLESMKQVLNSAQHEHCRSLRYLKVCKIFDTSKSTLPLFLISIGFVYLFTYCFYSLLRHNLERSVLFIERSDTSRLLFPSLVQFEIETSLYYSVCDILFSSAWESRSVKRYRKLILK